MFTGYHIGRVDCELSRRIPPTHRDIPKTQKFCMSVPVKFDEKLQIVKPAGYHPYLFLEKSDYVE